MFSLVEHIEYLISVHDCVVVPGWGALVAQYSSSSYDNESCVFQKPQRSIAFNAAVNHNDGMLAQSIVRREGLTYDEAVRFINDSVTTFKQQINAGNEVSLGRIGFFSANNGPVEFEPFYHEMDNDEYYGLRSLPIKTLARIKEDEENARQRFVAETQQTRRNSFTRTISIAASILLLIALSVVLTTPIIVDRNTNYADMGITRIEMPKHQVIKWDSLKADFAVALPQQAFEHKHHIHHHHDMDTQGAMQDTKATTAQAVDTHHGHGRYYLVVSSLSSTRQVNNFKKSHPDLAGRMEVVKHGKYYRIAVARGDSHHELAKVKETLGDEYSDAWVGKD